MTCVRITCSRCWMDWQDSLQTCQHWLIVKRVKPPPLPLPFPSPTVTHFSLSLPIIPLSPSFIQLGDLKSAVSSPIGSRQRAQPPNVFWCNGGQNLACHWVEGLAKWVNIYLQIYVIYNGKVNSCTWLAEFVFNLTICHFKRDFSDCVG